MKPTLLIPLILALIVGVAVLVIRGRSASEERPAPASSSDASPSEPEAAPKGPLPPDEPDVSPSEPEAKPDLRSLFERLLEALRSGDRDRIREALAALEDVLTPEPVPDEENAALVYQKAFEKLSILTDEEKEAFDAFADGKELSADQLALLRKYLDRNRETLELLREAAGRPRCRFPIDYSKGFETELPHVSSVMEASRLLLVAARLSEEGTAGAGDSWALAESTAGEPIVVSQLIRGICHVHASEILQAEWSRGVSPEVLEKWIRKADPGAVREAMERGILYELQSGVKLAVDDKVPDTFFSLYKLRKPQGPMAAQELAHYAETLHEVSSLVGRPYYEVKDRLEQLERSRIENAPWYAEYTRQMLPAFARGAARVARTEAGFGATRVAAAVELYRRQEGVYPSSLGDLGVYLPDRPRDPFTGKDFMYRRDGSGFVVYSVGEDGADGGGSADHDVVFRVSK